MPTDLFYVKESTDPDATALLVDTLTVTDGGVQVTGKAQRYVLGLKSGDQFVDLKAGPGGVAMPVEFSGQILTADASPPLVVLSEHPVALEANTPVTIPVTTGRLKVDVQHVGAAGDPDVWVRPQAAGDPQAAVVGAGKRLGAYDEWSEFTSSAVGVVCSGATSLYVVEWTA